MTNQNQSKRQGQFRLKTLNTHNQEHSMTAPPERSPEQPMCIQQEPQRCLKNNACSQNNLS